MTVEWEGELCRDVKECESPLNMKEKCEAESATLQRNTVMPMGYDWRSVIRWVTSTGSDSAQNRHQNAGIRASA